MRILQGLNPAQREAVEAVDGPLLILAGPGSGKTRVIVHRVAYLLEHRGLAPFNIMAVTFTNKAARELRERLDGLVGPRAQHVAAGTFHALCARWLRRDIHHLGLDASFTIYDENDQLDLVKVALREMEVDDTRFTPRSFLNAISAAKNELVGPHEYAEHAQGHWQQLAARVFRRYQELLRRNQALDFDDLLGTTVQLFRQHPEVLERYQERYRYILVDEFQDTNPVQYALVRLLGGKHRNICAVGDPDQSIYGFRAADIRNVFYFERDFPELRVVKLEQNYRSTQTILDVAHAVISTNRLRKEKDLWTENDRGTPVVLYEAYDERDEAQWVVRAIERLVSHGDRYGDVAVMYRTNAQSRALEDCLVRAGLPYRLVGSTRFYERREIKDVLAYLRVLQNPLDSVCLGRILNVPSRGIGAKTVSELGRHARESGRSLYEAIAELAAEPINEQGADVRSAAAPLNPRARNALAGFVELMETLRAEREQCKLTELLDRLLARTGYARHLRDGSEEGEERWANVMELRSKAHDYEELEPALALTRFLEEVSLVQAVDEMAEGQNAVTLITLHQAKGLEFQYVFIVGIEEGLCPHSRSLDDGNQMEEERRLFYVGITRAMRNLGLAYTYKRTIYGGESMREPSRFLKDIPDNLVQTTHQRAATPQQWSASPQHWSGRPDRDPSRHDGPITTHRAPLVRPAPSERPGHPTPDTQHPTPGTQPPTQPQFKSGDRVQHPAFGRGLVVSSQVSGGDEVVTVVFEEKGIKKLSLSFAPLQRA